MAQHIKSLLRFFGSGNERIKKLINTRKIFDHNIVMFRSKIYCNRFEYISIQLVTEPRGNSNQRKNGYTILINDRSSFFDWYNAYMYTGYANDDAIAMINDAVLLMSDLRVKQNGKVTMGLICFE